MRRGKKTLVPESSVVPAFRLRPATKEPEAPLKTRNTPLEEPLKWWDASPEALLKSRDTPPPGSPAAGASPLRAPHQAAGPETKAPPPADAADDSAPASETDEAQESPPPPPGQRSVDVGQCARALALEVGTMFNIFRSIPTQMVREAARVG